MAQAPKRIQAQGSDCSLPQAKGEEIMATLNLDQPVRNLPIAGLTVGDHSVYLVTNERPLIFESLEDALGELVTHYRFMAGSFKRECQGRREARKRLELATIALASIRE